MLLKSLISGTPFLKTLDQWYNEGVSPGQRFNDMGNRLYTFMMSVARSKESTRQLIDGIAACSAIVAAADGKVLPEEKAKMLQSLRACAMTRNLDQSQLSASYDVMIHLIDQRGSPDFVLQELDKLNDHDEDIVDLALLTALAVCLSDNHFAERERIALEKICQRLGYQGAERMRHLMTIAQRYHNQPEAMDVSDLLPKAA